MLRFLLEFSQKSGCFCALRLQFLCHRALSNGDLFHTRDLQDLPPKLCEKRWIKSRISCEFFRSFPLRFVNIPQKIATFDIDSDFQKSSFSSNPDKNNWTRNNGLSHPGNSLYFHLLFRSVSHSPLNLRVFRSSNFSALLSYGPALACGNNRPICRLSPL